MTEKLNRPMTRDEAQFGAIIDWMTRAIEGGPLTDFEASFPTVRAAMDLRHERDALAAEIAALRATLIGWVELGEEMRRILENDVLIADWFAPRLYAALARGSAPTRDPADVRCPQCGNAMPVVCRFCQDEAIAAPPTAERP